MLTIEKLTIMQPLFAHLMMNKFLDEGFLNQFQDTNDKASRFLHFAGAALSFRRFVLPNKAAWRLCHPILCLKTLYASTKEHVCRMFYGRGVKERGNFIILSVAAMFMELWMARFAFKKRIRLLLHK